MKRLAQLLTLAAISAVVASGQAVYPVPYSAQLKTDPAVGNVQGIQRYGRPLKTDPDQGEGFSYHVYPVMPQAAVAASTVTEGSAHPSFAANRQQDFRAAQGALAQDSKTAGLRLRLENLRRALPHQQDAAKAEQIRTEIHQLETRLGVPKANQPDESTPSADAASGDVGLDAEMQERSLGGYSPSAAVAVTASTGYAPPVAAAGAFDWTAGIRSGPTPHMNPYFGPGLPTELGFGPMGYGGRGFGGLGAVPYGLGSPEMQAIAITRSALEYAQPAIYHQPLIQIKVRVIEVARANGTFSNSVLELVSRADADGSLTSGSPLNNGFENARGLTRFAIPGLVSSATSGTGLLVNLTGEHINWIASFLATELNADVVTAPELVTLNGQNVEFLAGEKVPFELGQNVISGNNNNIQQVFYKHVGTMVSITPRIVNWGLYGEGDGEAPLTSQQIADWNLLVEWMSLSLGITKLTIPAGQSFNEHPLNIYYGPNAKPVPLSIRGLLLLRLGDYSRRELIDRGFPLQEICTDDACRWSPENCTIDLSLVVRLSDAAKATDSDPDAEPSIAAATREANVRAVANVVQLKSGHGVVMAGLIGMREIDEASKVPVLGDLPYVGALFRSRAKTRLKTEVLVFVEARVLDSRPEIARYQSAEDYRLSQPFVRGELLDNPLECCLQRSGMHPYVCECGCEERDFWVQHGNDVRQAKTQLNDILK